MLARAKKCSTKTKNVNTLAEKEESLSRDKIKVGDFLSNYQFFCNTPVSLPTGYGRDSSGHCF